MPEEQQLEELIRQLIDGNGMDNDDTRGMTLRELVLELRQDLKSYPQRKEVYTVFGILSGVLLTLWGIT